MSCNSSGASPLVIAFSNSMITQQVYSQVINVYTYNNNFVTYGTSADTFIPSSENQCAGNISLGFTFNYFSIPFTSVSVCKQANIVFSSITSSYQIAAVNTNGLSVNSSLGSISYRTFNQSSALAGLASDISCAYSVGCVFNFTARNAFVVTWNHVPYSSNNSLECNAQIILVTDGVYSFFAMKFGVVDLYTFSYFRNITQPGFTQFTSFNSTSNLITYSFLSNGPGDFLFSNYTPQIEIIFNCF